MTIHKDLLWHTIIKRANKYAGGDVYRFRHDEAYGNIYEFCKQSDAYLFVCSTLTDNKEYFIKNFL